LSQKIMASNTSKSSSASSSSSPPPMTTRQKARHVAQAKQPRLKYVVDPPILDNTESQSIEVKDAVRNRFNNLCEEAGWTLTDAIRDALMVLTKIDAGWRQRDCEAALFAFVQHLDFVWVNGWVLLGRKKFREGVLCVWYRPEYSPNSRRIEFSYGSEKTIFKPNDLKDRVDKDKIWLPFTKLFDLTNIPRDKQNLYLIGVYEILHRFTYMRGILDPHGSEDSVLRPGHPNLPFLPGSAWLRQQGVLLIDGSPKDRIIAAKPRGKLESHPSDALHEHPHNDNGDARQLGGTTPLTSTAGSKGESQTCISLAVNGTRSTVPDPASNSSTIELEKMRRQKRKATSSPDGSPTRKQARLSDAESEIESPIAEVTCSTQSLYQSHCRQFQWTPSATTLQAIIDLLQSHDLQIESAEASLLAFVQYSNFVWENDRIFIGSRKVEGARRYERVWYKTIHRDGICHGEFSIDAGRQPCSPSVENVEIEYFWPFFNSLFDMKELGSANRKQQEVYIAGTYLMLLQYPALRRYQSRSSGTGIKLAPRAEGFELPFPPESSQANAKVQASQLSSSGELMPAGVLQPVTNIQCRQSESSARTLAEVLREQETQHKITTMIQESACAYIADPEPAISPGAPVSTRVTEPSKASPIIANTPEPVYERQDQGVVGGILEYLLRNMQASSSVETTSKGLKFRLMAHLPEHLFHQPALKLCPMVLSETTPISPSRDCIVRRLEKIIAMGLVKSQQPAAHQEHTVTSQECRLPAPIAMMTRVQETPSSSSLTIDQAREVLHGPRAKITSCGEDKGGGLELVELSMLFPFPATETRAVELKFSTVLSVDTLPVSLTRIQALRALTEYAMEDAEMQHGV
jgi:hypothetical protein